MNIWRRIYELKVWKKRPFGITIAFCSLLVLFCLIKIVIPCEEWEYECKGGQAFEEGNSGGNTVVRDGICLKPGVYRIELAYNTDTDMVAMCNVADGTVFYKGLLSNGEHLYSGLHRTGYEIWLYESTQALQIIVPYGGVGSLEIGNVRIIETNQLWTMLLAIVLFMGSVICAVQIFYYYDNQFHVAPHKKQVFFWVMVISFIASIPYLCGYTITGADLTYHLQRIEGVKDGLLGGQFPVRLEPKWVYDHGYANAIFYCNGLLYLPALLRLLGFPVVTSYNIYCIVLTIATAWISYYCFGRIFRKNSIGIVCSALYTLSIFRIYRLVIVTAVGEGTAVTFLPLVLYGLYRIFVEDPEKKEYRTAWVPLAFGLSGLIQSHVLTCEITAMVVVLFCLVFIKRIFKSKVFWALCKGAVATVGVNLWFLIPFLDYYLTQDVRIRNVSTRTIQDRGIYFVQLLFHFWHTNIQIPSEAEGEYFQLVGMGVVFCIVLVMFLGMWISGKFRKSNEKMILFVKAASVTGILLMYMSLNIFPWDRIQTMHPVISTLVSSLQFPYRFLGWGTTSMVLVFGCCMWYFMEHGREIYHWGMIGAAFLIVTTSSMYLLDFVNRDQGYFELYNEEGMGFGYISGAEYLIEGTDLEKLTFADTVAGGGMEIYEYHKEYLRAMLQCANRGQADSYVELPMLMYKGYRAVWEETGQEMQLCAGDNNVIRVLIPEGFEGNIKVEFVSPVYWRFSELASVLAIMAMVVMWRKNVVDMESKKGI